MAKVFAERKLIFVAKGSSIRKDLTVRIGVPYWMEDGTAACPIEWDGLYDKVADARGMDLLQALHLAADIDPWLEQLIHKYDFFWPSGESYHEDDVHLPS